ncbi:NAD(P)-dependent oxidoreductase [Salinibacter altiplanensis]|uniref:NAD(P)-dependent oxidoreductase n=1 Tax=Salinibacter altiplanensis TaxID=1803181 RepID=UPI0018F8910D
MRGGEIAGAGLSVFETGPLSSDSLLWNLEEVLVTPHVGGTSTNYYQRVDAILRTILKFVSRSTTSAQQKIQARRLPIR